MTLQMPVWLQKGNYTGQNDRWLIDTFLEAGVLDGQPAPTTLVAATDAAGLKPTADASTLSVDVAPGTAVIAGSDQVAQGKYVCVSDASVNVPLAARPASGQNRVDVVYARVVDTAAGVTGTDGWTLAAVTGTPSSGTPTVPALPTSSLALAQVTVGGGTGATIGANAADLLVDVRPRMRLRGPKLGWDPIRMSWTGAAGSFGGTTGLCNFSIGPYPCKWVADITAVCLFGGQPANLYLADNSSIPYHYLTQSRTVPAGPANVASAFVRYLYERDDGGAQAFTEVGDLTTPGSGNFVTNADPTLHRVDAIVHLCP